MGLTQRSQGTHFPKERNNILPFPLAVPYRIFPKYQFLNQRIGSIISLEELKIVQRTGTNENTKRICSLVILGLMTNW